MKFYADNRRFLGWSRIYAGGSGAWQAGGADIRWQVSDQLGTPRMAADRTGSLAGVTRHDYLPFGEEVAGDPNGRTPERGYKGDAVRQKFTGQERDDETGLDYFGARYYAGTQGRFTSVDPVIIKKARLLDPQRINLYAYVRNNPLKFIDPDGADLILAEGLKPSQREFIVKNMARLYMTDKGRQALERADQSPFKITVGKGELERKRVGPPVQPGTTVFGGTEMVTGGVTRYDTYTDSKTKEKVLAASGPPGTETLNPIRVLIDKDNSADIGKDAARVMQHEIGGHVNAVLDLAERPDPNNPAFTITGLEEKPDEKNAQKVEKELGSIPDKPTPEAIKAVEELLKPRKKE
jgi:RHS repeat-associated protein